MLMLFLKCWTSKEGAVTRHCQDVLQCNYPSLHHSKPIYTLNATLKLSDILIFPRLRPCLFDPIQKQFVYR